MSYLLLRKAVSLLLLTSLLSACTDHQLTPPAGQRIRLRQETIAYTGGSTFFKTDFEYDQLNRLSSLVRSFPFHIPGSSDTVQRDRGTFTYDEQSRVVRYDYRIDRHLFCCGKPLVYGERTDVTYDASGKIATMIKSEALSDFGDFKPIEKRRLEFGADNQVIKEIYISLSDGSESTGVYNYVNGNLVGTGPDFLVEYDNAPNPYYGLLLPLFLDGRRDGYSRNNVIKSVSTSRFPQMDGTELTTTSTAAYQNSYNEKGLLVKSVLTITPLTRGSSSFINTRYFVYETY